MSDVTIRIAAADEIERLRAAYEEWGYDGGAAPGDLVFVAECAGVLVGIARQTVEHDTVMLRGMQVAPAARGGRVGTQLLRAFVSRLAGRECYCTPYSHLVEFYARAGFEPCREDAAPAFLRDRLARYRHDGLDVLLMRRPAGSADRDRAAERTAVADKCCGHQDCCDRKTACTRKLFVPERLRR